MCVSDAAAHVKCVLFKHTHTQNKVLCSPEQWDPTVPRSGASREGMLGHKCACVGSLRPQNCMVMVEQNQVWVGSEDSVIYIISIHSMSCNKQLTEHRASVTGLAVQPGTEAPRYGGPPGRGAGALWATSCGAGGLHAPGPCSWQTPQPCPSWSGGWSCWIGVHPVDTMLT